MSRKYKIAVLKGDGIGPEVVYSAKQVLSSAVQNSAVNLEFIDLQIGWESYKSSGRTLPPDTLKSMEECDGWILGPLEAGSYPKDDRDYPMASGKIRRAFDLFANIRPVKSLLPGPPSNIDLVIVRENTEDFYPDRNLFKGYGEFMPDEDTVISLRVVTKKACRRISETAFALSRSRAKKKLVTAVHKSNVLIEGDGLFLEQVRQVAKNHPDIKLNEGLVDSVGMQIVLSPEKFDVLVTTNLFGDILSDVAAAKVGGLGLAPSLNSGERYAMAQAVHGSAPDIAGKGIANPVAEILSAAMLMEWLHAKYGEDALKKTAETMELAVERQLSTRNRESLTVDLGGVAKTQDFTSQLQSLIEHMN
ncbi:MAG: isocitrate/isopropylmalate dehydrogenase family protein [Nitrososphaerales archaeon]